MNPSDQLDTALKAPAHPARRAILAQLAQGDATVNEIAAPFDMSLPAVSRHIKVLEDAGLITRGRDAQFRPCQINPEPIKAIVTWAEAYRPIWESRFERMEHLLNAMKGMTIPIAEMDVSIGGTRKICMEMVTPDRTMQMWFIGVYKEINAPTRLVYTESMCDADGTLIPPEQMGMPAGHPDISRASIKQQYQCGRKQYLFQNIQTTSARIHNHALRYPGHRV